MPTGLEDLDLKVYVDYPQERQNPKGPYVFATDGTQIDSASLTDCIFDPCTLSFFGKPLPMTDEWKSGTGASDPASPYYRFQKSDFTFTSAGGAGDWLDIDYYANGDAYFIAGTAVTARQQSPIELTNGVSRNEPLFFSYSKLQKKNSDTNSVVKLFWSDPENVQNNTQLHFNADGSCNVFRGYETLQGTIVADTTSNILLGFQTKFTTQLVVGSDIYDSYGRFLGTVTGITTDISASFGVNSNFTYTGPFTDKITPKKVQSYSRTESNYSQGRPISTIANPNDQFNDVYIIPMRARELLVLTSYGLNFSHTFDDLNVPNPPSNINWYYKNLSTSSPTDTNISSTPVITPKGDFSIVISQGKVAVQLAKLYFKGNWSIQSQPIQFNSPPPIPSNMLTGFISSSFGSTEVIGTGTSFTTQLSVGDRLSASSENNGSPFNSSNILGSIAYVNSNTSLYLDTSADIKTSNRSYFVDTPLSGTLSFGIGSTVVTGSGTAFSTELSQYDLLYDNNSNLLGTVKQINSNTNLFLDSDSYLTGTNQTPIFKNVNVYKDQYYNLQAEKFGQAYPVEYTQAINMNIAFSSTEGEAFNNISSNYIMTLKQENTTDPLSTNAIDFGIAHYSSDFVLSLINQNTSNSTVDITSALESLSINRNETGELSLSLSARHQTLLDLGVVKPDILSNRSIKVALQPRIKQLEGTITLDGTTVITGVSTSFTSDFSIGDRIYKLDGTLIGIVSVITNDTNLTVLINNVAGIEYNIDYSNEPIYSPIIIFDGYLDSPDIDYIQGLNYEKYALLSFNAIDKKQKLNANYFNTAPNFDNNDLTDIISQIINLSGQSSNNNNVRPLYYDYTFYYALPINRNNSQGQYNYTLNLGDSAGGFIEKIRSDFAQNFVFFNRGLWVPNNKTEDGFTNASIFYMKDIDNIRPGAPDISLYLNEESALNDGGIPIYQSYKRTIRNLQKTYETPEANRILITGLDKTNGNRIEYIKDDVISQQASLPPANRPDNWLGDIYPFVMINDKLNSLVDVERAGQQFYEKLTPGRTLIEFDSDYLYFFDNTYSYTPSNRTPLSGTITTNTSTTLITGVGTLFTTELSIGDTLYNSDGVIIGIVAVISNDTSLDLLQNAAITYSDNYNNYTEYLNQYSQYDIGDKLYINDLEGNAETYEIIDFSVDFVREYTNPGYTTIIPRNAKYRAKNITIPSSNPPIFISLEDGPDAIPFSNNFWIVTSGYDLRFKLFAVSLSPLTYTLSNEPVGMSVTYSNNLAEITWTPGVGDENQVYEDIIVTASNGVSSAEYKFSIRVYTDL